MSGTGTKQRPARKTYKFQEAPTAPLAPTTAVTPVNPASAYNDVNLRLLRRITYGPRAEDVKAIKQLGFTAYLEQQLDYAAINDDLCQTQVKARYPRLNMTARQIYQSEEDWQTMEQLIKATIYRSAFSKRQLFERMVEFWSDHFNIYSDKVGAWLKVPDDRTTIRRHALGTFPNMLWASAHSAAMMMYLDNESNSGYNPNQNYARELMELHTLGVNGGYTQKDVIEVARCFTGWKFNWDGRDPNGGEFVFSMDEHDTGSKVVLGQTIPAGGGISDGETVLKILYSHPSCAKFISTKMIRWLLRYDPPAQLVEDVAAVYMRTKGDIRAMIRKILTPANLTGAPAKYKRPYHLFVSMIRALQPKITSLDSVEWDYLYMSGHMPFGWPAPNGYPDALGYWYGYLLPRWNFSLNLLSDGLYGLQVSMTRLANGLTDPTLLAQRIDDTLFAGEMLPGDKADVLKFLKAKPIDENRIRGAYALALAFPSFQWY